MTGDQKFILWILVMFYVAIIAVAWAKPWTKFEYAVPIGMNEPTRVWPIVPFTCEDQSSWPCTFDENGYYHSKNDLPAAGDFFGVYWHKHGVIHRIGGPAALMRNGDRYWYEDGVLVRYQEGRG